MSGRLVGATITLALLLAGAFGADVGRVRVADAELAVATEAAATAAVAYLDGTPAGVALAQRKAVAVAVSNPSDAPITVADVEVGRLTDGAFRPAEDAVADAVRVTATVTVRTWLPTRWLGADVRTARWTAFRS